jgi:DNA polymerase-3 subunit delta
MNEKSAKQAQVFLYFGDEYLVADEVGRLVDRIVGDENRLTNVTVIDGANAEAATLSNALFTVSLFGGKRVVLIEHASFLMGRADEKALAAKAASLWREADRKGALRAFARLASSNGASLREILSPEWIHDALGGDRAPEDVKTLTAVAEAYAEAGGGAGIKADDATLLELISRPFPDGVFLIVTATGVDKRKRLYKAFETVGVVKELTPPADKSGKTDRSFFDQRVTKILRDSGKSISDDALSLMRSRSGRDMRRLHAELEKLVSYMGSRAVVSVEDVQTVFSDFHESVFFDLSGALRKRDFAAAARALHEQQSEGVHPLMLLGSIAGEIRRLMCARELLFREFKGSWKPSMTFREFQGVLTKVRKDAGTHGGKTPDKQKLNVLSMNDYRVYYYLRDAARFPMDRLTEIMEALLEADIVLKSNLGASCAPALLERLAFKICNG